jgi:hypothetical protein
MNLNLKKIIKKKLELSRQIQYGSQAWNNIIKNKF